MSIKNLDGVGGEWNEDGTPTENSLIQEPLCVPDNPRKPSYAQLESSLAEAQAQLENYNKYCEDGQAYEGPQFWTDRIECMERSLAEAREEIDGMRILDDA